MNTFLDEVQLKKIVPSVFATGGASNTSDRYGFIPTIDVIRGLRNAGFMPVKASQTRSRSEDGREFGKHLIRFRHESNWAVSKEDGMFPEIVLMNSHDGSSSYQLRAGIYRLVCSNGLIVGNDVFCRRIKHQGDVVHKVVGAATDLIEISPISVRKANEWSEVKLLPEHKQVFAETAAMLKWDKEVIDAKPFAKISEGLLNPRRYQDHKDDLWTTFNVIQENMIQGGVRYRTDAGSRQKTREVGSVTENVRLNTSLWALTEKMAELAKR
jgi:hypothetical protein